MVSTSISKEKGERRRKGEKKKKKKRISPSQFWFIGHFENHRICPFHFQEGERILQTREIPLQTQNAQPIQSKPIQTNPNK
jgi:hypothetical protein